MLTETLGFDVAINYKSPEFESHLSDTLNVSVGGSVSESVLQYANLNARVPICGQIASYEQNISRDELAIRMNILRVPSCVITYDLNRWSDFDI